MESMELTKASKNIQDGIGRCDLHQKRLESADEEEGVICRLG